MTAESSAFSAAVRTATDDDIDALVELQRQLFAEDALTHDTFVDPDWPATKGYADFADLLAAPSCLVLVATSSVTAAEPTVVGFLVGYTADASPTRLPVRFAVLRSLYVRPDGRGHGVGENLTRAFLDWALEQGCVEAHVSAYVANEGAHRFYERLGFAARSTERVKPLGPADQRFG